MGRIKTSLIKRIAKDLFKEHASELTTDFTENKKVVDRYTNIESAKIRNIVAGYTARLSKQHQKQV